MKKEPRYIIFEAKDFEQKREFTDHLKNLGYRNFNKKLENDGLNIIKIYGSSRTNRTSYLSGDPESWRNHEDDIILYGKDEGVLEAAIAIAAIWNDNIDHEGEWVVIDETIVSGGDDLFTKGKLYELGGRYWKDYNKTNFVVKATDQGTSNGRNKQYIKYHKASPEEIINFFMKKNGVIKKNKKIIGYRIIKDGPGFKSGTELRIPLKIKRGQDGWADKVRQWDTERVVRFPEDVIKENPDWFEAIYEDEEKIETLTLGSNNDSIQISSKSLSVRTSIGDIPIEQIRDLYTYFTREGLQKQAVNSIIGYDVTLPEDGWRIIRIGCSSEDHRFSPSELKQIIDKYEELHKDN